jgi:NAD(P)H-dependent flavin oxidoreductase YrpB (nitropropane dioxygenase family)
VVHFPIDVEGADSDRFTLDLDAHDLVGPSLPPLVRPVFLAIISSHVLAAFLARDEEVRPDGFVVEAPPAGGHNAPPRKVVIDDDGVMVFGPRDEPDLGKIAAIGLPFWLAGAAGTPEALLEARAAGAMGVQVGTDFALCVESGLDPAIRERLVAGIADGTLHVRTDPLASPTGFPFKVAQLDDTMSDDAVYAERPRLCDLGFLRTPFLKEGDAVGYRCAAEPEHMYIRKHGELESTVDRKCICNGLTAAVGMAQTRKDGYTEVPIVTLGSDTVGPRLLAAAHPGRLDRGAGRGLAARRLTYPRCVVTRGGIYGSISTTTDEASDWRGSARWATVSTIVREMSCAVSPHSASTSDRLP